MNSVSDLVGRVSHFDIIRIRAMGRHYEKYAGLSPRCLWRVV